MKRIFMILVIFTLLHVSLVGQWYYKDHGVTDPMLLSMEQFDQSIKRATRFTLLGSGITLTGTAMAINLLSIREYSSPSGIGEGILATFENGLIGVVVMPVIVTGVIITIINASNLAKIKSARSIAFSEESGISLAPTIILTPGDQSKPGILISINF